MLLSKLLPNQILEKNPLISGIEIDSRNVNAGDLFFSIKGTNTDGAKFIPDAIKKGAVAIICDSDVEFNLEKNPHALLIKVADVRLALVKALKIFYPDLPSNILAVTGTNGKTSVAEYIRQLQQLLGFKSASIGTLGIKTFDPILENKLHSPSLTTPDIVSLYKNLAILKQHGVNDIAIEASSIGIEQGRLDGLDIKLGAFTNFSQDHLDYHRSMENYFNCKMMLYSKVLKPKSLAILNADIAEFSKIKQIAQQNQQQIFTYGKKGDDATLLDLKPENAGQIFNFKIFGKEYLAKINILGEFQVVNILCALLAVASYYQLDQNQLSLLISRLDELVDIKGRMQRVVRLKNNAQIFIDYAHTPDAVRNVLENTRKIPHRKIIILFGCGGNRDAKKRPIMGEVASNLADLVIVTDDNPRYEDPKLIRQEILQACDPKKTIEIDNRQEAIIKAIKMLGDDDILIIAGKGHEQYQIIKDQKIAFDEEKIVLENLCI